MAALERSGAPTEHAQNSARSAREETAALRRQANLATGRIRPLALLGGPREELRRLVLNGLTVALGASQVGRLMLGDVFDMLENLTALRATVSVRRHGAAPT